MRQAPDEPQAQRAEADAPRVLRPLLAAQVITRQDGREDAVAPALAAVRGPGMTKPTGRPRGGARQPKIEERHIKLNRVCMESVQR